jgi:hypothetical protein
MRYAFAKRYSENLLALSLILLNNAWRLLTVHPHIPPLVFPIALKNSVADASVLPSSPLDLLVIHTDKVVLGCTVLREPVSK